MSTPILDLTTTTPLGSVTPAQLLFSDLPRELAATRRTLERVPDGRNDWQPHDKSMTLGRLATHIAELPNFASTILTTDELDWSKTEYVPRTLETTAERLAVFDELAASMQAVLDKAQWQDMTANWTMRMGDHVILNDRKGLLLRTAGISHIIHHRAQLTVYLRLLGMPVPSLYGPSADES